MITINRADHLEGKINIIYSPLSELSLAMDLLCLPEHHKLHLPWATKILKNLSIKEKEQMKFYENILDGYLNLDLHIDYLHYPYKKDLKLSTCSDYLCNRENWISPLEEIQRGQLMSFLHYMWESYIFPIVTEHISVISQQMDSGYSLIEKSGNEAFLKSVNDRISFSKKRELQIEKWLESDFFAEELNIFYVELSLFAFPHLMISDRHDEGFFWLSWDVPFRNDSIFAPGIERISAKSFALSDKSRLRILLMLSENPMTQKDLTRQMGFAKSTISRHINILLDAGLLVAEGGERNVQLKVNKKILERFSKEILDLFH